MLNGKNKKQLYLYIRIAALALLLINAAIFCSYTFFLHTHVLPDGTEVVHSHPYSSSDDEEGHEHNYYSFHILPNLAHFLTLQLSGEILYSDFAFTFVVIPEQIVLDEFSLYHHYRGPPLFC